MKHLPQNFLSLAILLSLPLRATATVHYVDVNSTNATPPYTNWATAATNIQDAVDAAVAGDEVVVTNGTYGSGGRDGNRVEVDKPLSVRSANGAQFTTIAGGASQAFRCVCLTNGSSLSGFTLTNGFAYDKGGGVLCESGNALLSNCVITGNSVYGDVYQGEVICPSVIECYGGGAYGVTLNNCMLSGNTATVTYFNNPIIGCYPPEWAHGGAAYNCTLNDCTLSGNSTRFDMAAYLSAPNGGGADGGGASECALNNCTLTRNFVFLHSYGDGWASGGGASHCALHNCTLTGNGALSVFSGYGSTYDGGASGCTLNNCINLGNSSGTLGSAVCEDCDSPGNLVGNNWFGDPRFVDTNGWANLRLQSNSPCINAGNNSYVTNTTDLDGNPRIVGGTVDIGAYEYQSPVSQISYAWLQYHGLPINSSTDTADPDGDGVDNYHEWLANSDPTNPLSPLPTLTLTPYGPNVILTWPTNVARFTLQSTTNLNPPILWNTNSPGPVVIGNQNVVINPITGPQQFYRLVH